MQRGSNNGHQFNVFFVLHNEILMSRLCQRSLQRVHAKYHKEHQRHVDDNIVARCLLTWLGTRLLAGHGIHK